MIFRFFDKLFDKLSSQTVYLILYNKFFIDICFSKWPFLQKPAFYIDAQFLVDIVHS